MRTVLANLSILSSVFLLASASAQQVCPAGYSDGDRIDYQQYVSVVFQGNTFWCERNTGGGFMGPFRGAKCGNRITYSDRKGVLVTSLGGVDYRFFGNDKTPHKVTKDCSAGSSCLVRDEHTNNAKSENVNVNFSVPITTIDITKIRCDRLSF